MKKYEDLYNMAKNISIKTESLFDAKGPGEGNISTNQFISILNLLVEEKFGEGYSQKRICGANALAVDFYFPDEGVIVEVAFGLKNSNTEYEKDILKALLAKSSGKKVDKLVFICKPGGKEKCDQPGRSAFKDWLYQNYKIQIDVWDL